MRGSKSDEQLARAAGRGDVAAFEALYERHHRALLSFSRHMLGRAHDAEDVVQHTFLEADRAFRAGKVPKAVRAWLYTVARNRCVSLLRARREDAGLPDAGVPSTENLAAGVEHRDDLRALLGDLRALPDDQRAALLLAELGDLTHAEVAKVIGVRAGKVKALVFQAREALLAAAHARAIPCYSIREEIANASGAALRKRHLKHHLAQCEGCSAFAADVRTQRAALGALLPVVPTVALREGVFAGLATGGAAAGAGAGAGIGAGILANSTAAKLLTTLAVGGAAAGGGVAVTHDDAPRAKRSAPPPAAAPRDTPPATPTEPARAPGASKPRGGAAPPEQSKPRRRDEAPRERARDQAPAERGRDAAPGQSKPRGRETAPGQTEPRGRETAPGQTEPRGRETAPGQTKPRGRETAPGQAKPRGRETAPGQTKPRDTAPPKVKVKPAPEPKVKPPKVKPAPAASAQPADGAAPEAVDVPPGQARNG